MKMLVLIFNILALVLIHPAHNTEIDDTSHKVSLDDDPSLFPGHMEPLGAKQPKTDIEILTEYPSPEGILISKNNLT